MRGSLAQADPLKPRTRLGARLVQREAVGEQLERRVLQSTRAGHQMKGLEHETDFAPSVARALLRCSPDDVVSVEQDAPIVGL